MLDRPADANAATGPPRFAPASRHTQSPSGPSLREVPGILRRRKWHFLLAMMLPPLLALVALGQITPRYTATGTLIYDPSEYSARELQSILRVDPTTDAVMASQAEIVRSLPAAGRIAERFVLDRSPEFNWRLRSPSLLGLVRNAAVSVWESWFGSTPAGPAEQTAEAVRHSVALAVQNAIKARNLKQTRLIEVSFTTEDPALAALAANMAMDIYVTGQLDAKFDAVKRASEWLRGRVADLRREVREGEDRIAAYRAREGLVQGVQAGLATEQVSRLNSDLLQAQAELAQSQARLDVARGRSGGAAQAAISPSVVQLRAQQEQISGQLNGLLARLGPNHPDVMTMRNQLNAVQRGVAGEIARVVAASEAEVRAGRDRVATLERNLADVQSQIDRNAQAQIPLNAMQRDVEASRTLLNSVLERIQQTQQQTAIEQPDARVVSPALPPNEPSFPRWKLMLAAAAAFGVFFGLLLVWLLELADTSLRSGDDVRARLGLPCFALVPQVSRRSLGWVRVAEYGVYKPLSPFAEQLRALRAGLWLRARQPKVVAITAARPSEGKTTVAVALGRSAALNGERVVVVDCDIRQPSLAQLLDMDGKSGLVDCLLGHATLAEIIQADELGSAAFIPAGSAEIDVAGLFTSDAMRKVLEQLRAEYDLVLLDAPPALAMTDARLLARLADATVLCVRWRQTPFGVVRKAVDLLEDAEAQIAGVALTRVDARAHVRAGYADSEVYHPRYGGYFRE
ncbi:MAG: polysaccharide biosynthesis tyrosine autokinase [Alphaproteobacteria bacterium]|nr:polysaccharide biosynthesis tyrosine autokinase [Alphaproteobacteria bacterium]